MLNNSHFYNSPYSTKLNQSSSVSLSFLSTPAVSHQTNKSILYTYYYLNHFAPIEICRNIKLTMDLRKCIQWLNETIRFLLFFRYFFLCTIISDFSEFINKMIAIIVIISKNHLKYFYVLYTIYNFFFI